ncbi:hypothetical protein [Thermosphaera sp.]
MIIATNFGTPTGENLIEAAHQAAAAIPKIADPQVGDLVVQAADGALAKAGIGAAALVPRRGDRYVIVEQGLADDAARGTALKTAYATAKTMSPSETSQVWVLIPPGAYDVGTSGLVLDTAWINISGLVPAKVANAGRANMVLEPTVLIYGAVSATNSGVIKQTANNVCIRDIEIKNTAIGLEPVWDDTDPAAYWPASGVTGTSLRRVKITGDDRSFDAPWATRYLVEYKQTWDECLVSGYHCVGGSGTVSGTITNSTISGDSCVGGSGIVSGTITNSTISGNGCVGGSGIVSGTITNSTISGDYCVGGYGTVSGTIIGCTISGVGCISSYGMITATARLTDVVVSGNNALNADSIASGAEFVRVSGVPTGLPAIGGKYLHCRLTNGTIFSKGFTFQVEE